MEWISVEDGLPETDKLLLVRVANSNLPAMAIFVGGPSDYWKVQPLFSKWHSATSCDVTHWMLFPEEESLPEQEEERTVIHVSVHCDDRLNEALCEAVGRCLTPKPPRKHPFSFETTEDGYVIYRRGAKLAPWHLIDILNGNKFLMELDKDD